MNHKELVNYLYSAQKWDDIEEYEDSVRFRRDIDVYESDIMIISENSLDVYNNNCGECYTYYRNKETPPTKEMVDILLKKYFTNETKRF
jgi:hypothetical protein